VLVLNTKHGDICTKLFVRIGGRMKTSEMLEELSKDWLVDLNVEWDAVNAHAIFALTIERRGSDQSYIYSGTTLERVVSAAYAGEPTRVG